MKTLGLAAVMFAAACGAAHAQAAQQRYQGTLFVTAAKNCENADGSIAAAVGDHYVFVFRHDSSKQAMSIVGQRRALAFVPNGVKFGAKGDFVGTYIPASALPRTAPGKYAGFALKPAQLTADTEAVQLSGRIVNFEGLTGCEVTFEAGGVRRPGF